MDKRRIVRTYPPYCFFDRRILCPPEAITCKCRKFTRLRKKEIE